MTPNNRFFEYFPGNLDVLLERAGWLLKNFGDEPNFLRVFDRNGKTRHVLWQIEAIHLGPVDAVDFAAGFDKAAERLHERTGHRAASPRRGRTPGFPDTLNGFTEGYNVYPTEEDGDTITRWARETVAAHRAHWV